MSALKSTTTSANKSYHRHAVQRCVPVVLASLDVEKKPPVIPEEAKSFSKRKTSYCDV